MNTKETIKKKRNNIKEENQSSFKKVNKNKNNLNAKKINLRNRNNDELLSKTQFDKNDTRKINISMTKSKSPDKKMKLTQSYKIHKIENKKDIQKEYSLCQKELQTLKDKEEELKLLRYKLKSKIENFNIYINNNFGKENKIIESKNKTINNKLSLNLIFDKESQNKHKIGNTSVLGLSFSSNNYDKLKMKKMNKKNNSMIKYKDNKEPNNFNKSQKAHLTSYSNDKLSDKHHKVIKNLKHKNRINLCLFPSNRMNKRINTEREQNILNKSKKKKAISLNKHIPSTHKNVHKNNNISFKKIDNITSIKNQKKSKTNTKLENHLNNSNIKKENINSSDEKINVIRNNIYSIGVISKAGEENTGEEKINQDNYFDYDLCHDYKFLGVCDGHGDDGQIISEYLKNILPEELNKELKKIISGENKRLSILESILQRNRNEEKNSSELKNEEKGFLIENLEKIEKIKELFKKVFISTNLKLIEENYMLNLENSGSTCISVFLQKTKINKIYIANVGDSRAIVIKDSKNNNDNWSFEQLSRDHKASEKDEAERILNHGGEIQQIQNENGEYEGPLRIFMKDEEGPGLAMTRSFGDVIGSVIGIIAEPEVKEYILKEEDRAIIIASDGLWEYVSNEEVAQIVKNLINKKDANLMVNELYKYSYEKWKTKDTGIDDITIICIILK